MLYRKRCAPFVAPKIEVPKLDENQLFLLSALAILRATQGDEEAEKFLQDFESENLLERGALRGFLELLDIHAVQIH